MEIIEEIKKAELEAENKKEQAKLKIKQALLESEKKAKQKADEMISEAEEQADEIKKKGFKKINLEIENFKLECEKKNLELIENSKANVKEAVNKVLECIRENIF